MLDAKTKRELITKFARHEKDGGSPEVQIAILTERIKQMSEHFSRHPKDTNSRRSFFIMIGRRKRLLSYLRRTNYDKYKEIIEQLGLRK